MIPSVLVYGARDETFWSGTPYYFASALREYGESANEPFNVRNVGPKRSREIPLAFAQWSLAHRSLRHRLFLLSSHYHDSSYPIGQPVPSDAAGMVSFSQVLPNAFLQHKKANPRFKLVQYIDVTLHDLMASFDYAKSPPPRVLASLLAAERAAYALVDRVCVFHEGVVDTLTSVYGMARSRVSVEGRGVNLSSALIGNPHAKQADSQVKLRMAVVGKGPKRKGVFQLIEAIDALSAAEQAQIELTLLGPDPSELPKRDYIRALGFIPAAERARLTEIMRNCDLGVLLSEADSHPGSIWEFLALGVPVWVTTLPHIQEELAGFPAMFEPLPLKPDSLVQKLRGLLADPTHLARLKAASTRSPRDLSWWRPAASVAEFIAPAA